MGSGFNASRGGGIGDEQEYYSVYNVRGRDVSAYGGGHSRGLFVL